MIRPALLAALPLIAAATMGCAQQVPPPIPPVPSTCGTEQLGRFIGKTRTDAIAAEVASVSSAKAIRWIAPGTMVTMDYRADRLNVDLDDKGVITRFRCG